MEDKLTQEEKALFDSLSKEKMPPLGLEDRIVQALNERNLLNKKDMKINIRKYWIIGIAASVLFFVAGYFSGSTGSGSEISSGYILLLHEDESFQPVGTDMEIFTEYASWMGKMMLDGISITGKELLPESTAWVGDVETYTAISESKDRTSGYFIIDVEDLKEAQRIAASSPHIKFGGSVELIKLSDRN